MKKLLAIIFWVVAVQGIAQTETFEKQVDYNGRHLMVDAGLVDRIKVVNWDKKEIGIRVLYSINDGQLNDLMSVSLQESGGNVKLNVSFDDKQIKARGYYNCDDENALTWDNKDNATRVCIDAQVEVSIPANADISVESIIGDLEISGVYGQLMAKTITGTINLTWPEKEGAEVEIKTVNGGIYSNREFQTRVDKGLPLISSHKINGKLGSGGKRIRLETVTSDIYFRAQR